MTGDNEASRTAPGVAAEVPTEVTEAESEVTEAGGAFALRASGEANVTEWLTHSLYAKQTPKENLQTNLNLAKISSFRTPSGRYTLTYGSIGIAMWSASEAMSQLTAPREDGSGGVFQNQYCFAVQSGKPMNLVKEYFISPGNLIDKHGALGTGTKAGTSELIPSVDVLFGDMRGPKLGEPGPATDVVNYVITYLPKMVILGVPEGKCQDIMTKLTDVATKNGYEFTPEKIQIGLHATGTYVSRTEHFFVAVRKGGTSSAATVPPNNQQLAFLIRQYLAEKLPLLKPELSSFMDTFEYDEEEEPGRRKKKAKETDNWKVDHMFVYNNLQKEWPAKPDPEFLSKVDAAKLNERQTEVLYIIEKKLKPPPNGVFLNLAKNPMHVNFTKEATPAESPWSPAVDIPLATTSSTPTIWYRDDGRLLTGSELMRLLGADVDYQNNLRADEDYPADNASFTALATTTYSIFGLVTIAMAMLSSVDTTSLEGEQQEEEDDESEESLGSEELMP